MKFTAICSFFEIYNENIYDLVLININIYIYIYINININLKQKLQLNLNDVKKNNLKIRQDLKKGIFIEDINEEQI